MSITHKLAVAAVGVGLGASGVLLGQAFADSSTPGAPPALHPTVLYVSTSGAAVQAADRAALLQMCREASNDPQSEQRFRSTAAAHPDIAKDINADCTLDIGRP